MELNNQTISNNVRSILSGIGYKRPEDAQMTQVNQYEELAKKCILSTIFDLALKRSVKDMINIQNLLHAFYFHH